MAENPPVTTGNAMQDSEIDSDEDVILSTDSGDDEQTIRTDDDIVYANDAAAEEDYAETQQNTDTEAASSDDEPFRDMHEAHEAESKRLLDILHQQTAARRKQPSPDLSSDAEEALDILSATQGRPGPDASLLQGLTPANAHDRIEQMVKPHVREAGSSLEEAVAAIGSTLMPMIRQSQNGHSGSESFSRQSSETSHQTSRQTSFSHAFSGGATSAGTDRAQSANGQQEAGVAAGGKGADATTSFAGARSAGSEDAHSAGSQPGGVAAAGGKEAGKEADSQASAAVGQLGSAGADGKEDDAQAAGSQQEGAAAAEGTEGNVQASSAGSRREAAPAANGKVADAQGSSADSKSATTQDAQSAGGQQEAAAAANGKGAADARTATTGSESTQSAANEQEDAAAAAGKGGELSSAATKPSGTEAVESASNEQTAAPAVDGRDDVAHATSAGTGSEDAQSAGGQGEDAAAAADKDGESQSTSAGVQLPGTDGAQPAAGYQQEGAAAAVAAADGSKAAAQPMIAIARPVGTGGVSSGDQAEGDAAADGKGAEAQASFAAAKAAGAVDAQAAGSQQEAAAVQKPAGLGSGLGPRPGGSRGPLLPPRPTRAAKPSQTKPAEVGGEVSQDRAEAPSEQPEVATTATHQQPQPQQSKPEAQAPSQAQPAAPAAQSALPRDPQSAQSAVHPGNGNALARGTPQSDPEESAEVQELRLQVNSLRISLFRLARRLNQTPNSTMIQQVIYRLDLAERIKAPFRSGVQRSPLASAAPDLAAQAESRDEPLNFEVSVMLLGMAGVGKSTLINRLLGENVAPESAFGDASGNKVQVFAGDVKGISLKLIDTPGLEVSSGATAHNRSVLRKIKAAHRKHKPNMIFYVDRMDMVRRQQADLHALQMITETLGPALWFNSILILTHAGEPVPEGPQGDLTFEAWQQRRFSALQGSIRQSAGDHRLLNPTQPVDNSPKAARNPAGESLLPNNMPWRPNLLLMAAASRLLSTADGLLKTPAAARSVQQQQAMAMLRGQRIPPVPYLVSQMVQPHKPKKPAEDEAELKHQDEISKLPIPQQKEEYKKRREYVKLRREEAKAANSQQGSVAVPGPETPLPPSFDGEPQSHRYRFLESNTGWLARPFVEAHGVDHDDNVDGFSIERVYTLRKPDQYLGGAPSTVIVQLHKDKNQFSLQSEADSSYWHRSNWVSSVGLGLQNIQSDMLYNGQLQTRVRFLGRKGPKAAVGVLLSRLSEGAEDKQSIPLPTKGPRAMGFKIEGKYRVHSSTKLVAAVGKVRTTHTHTSEEALAANVELRLRKPDGNKQMLIGGSAMKFRRDLALGGNISGQFMATRRTQVAPRVNYTNKGQGTISLRVTSHDKPQLGYTVAIPLVLGLLNRIRSRKEDEDIY